VKSLEHFGSRVTFKYDPSGRRIEKTTSTTTSVFAYDGDNLIEETNSSGGVVAGYTRVAQPLAFFLLTNAHDCMIPLQYVNPE
jgi:YD repeat-containing protein